MSTDHKGDYCAHKDKMMMSRQEASSAAGRLGMEAYKCDECGSWHITHRLRGGARISIVRKSIKEANRKNRKRQ